MSKRDVRTRDFIKVLERNGFELVRSSGDHLIYKKENCRDNIAITGGKMNAMIVRRLTKTYNLI